MGGSGGRGGRRSTQLAVAAADQVGDVGVALADRLGLDRRRCRGRARRGTPRAGAGRAAAGGRAPPPRPRVSTIAVTRVAAYAALASLAGRNLGRLRGFRAVDAGLLPASVPAPSHVQTPRRHPPAAARRLPRGGVRVARQSMTFEAPRELLSTPDARRARSTRSRGFGVDRSPRARLLAGLRARPRLARRSPDFDAADPNAYPAGTWDTPRRAGRRRAGARDHGHADAHRPGPALGDQGASATTSRSPSPKEFRRFATAVGRRYGDRVEHVVDLERAQPPAVPRARSTSSGKAAVRRSSTASSTAPASAGSPPSGNGARHAS